MAKPTPKRARPATSLQDLAYRMDAVTITANFRKAKGTPFLVATIQMKTAREAVEVAALFHDSMESFREANADVAAKGPQVTVERTGTSVVVTADALSMSPSRYGNLPMLQLAERMHAAATALSFSTREQMARTETRRRRRGSGKAKRA